MGRTAPWYHPNYIQNLSVYHFAFLNAENGTTHRRAVHKKSRLTRIEKHRGSFSRRIHSLFGSAARICSAPFSSNYNSL